MHLKIFAKAQFSLSNVSRIYDNTKSRAPYRYHIPISSTKAAKGAWTLHPLN